MDDVPMPFNMPAFQSADFVGVKFFPIVITGNKENSFTVVLLFNLSLGNKLPLIFIFKKKRIP